MNTFAIKACKHLKKVSMPGFAGTPRMSRMNIWFWILSKWKQYAFLSHNTEGKHICFGNRWETHAQRDDCVCVGRHKNTAPDQLSILTPSTDSSVIIHQCSIWKLPPHICHPPYTPKRKKRLSAVRVSLHCHNWYITTGVFVRYRIDSSGREKQGIDLHLKTCCGSLIHKKDPVSRVMWCQ